MQLLIQDGGRWLVAAYGERKWVKNARAAGEVELTRAGKRRATQSRRSAPTKPRRCMVAFGWSALAHARTGRGSRAAPLRVSVQEAVLKGVANELGAGGDAQLLHDVRSMGLGGAHRDVEQVGDLLVCMAQGEQAQHVALTV